MVLLFCSGVLIISIHALRVEGDHAFLAWRRICSYFYPRPPGGGRRRISDCVQHVCDFYPRPPGGGRLYVPTPFGIRKIISIHALRVEGDFTGLTTRKLKCISIHALRVEGDVKAFAHVRYGERFLSTPSGWRATVSFADRLGKIDISIHALRVEGDFEIFVIADVFLISIHALRVEGDPQCRL